MINWVVIGYTSYGVRRAVTFSGAIGSYHRRGFEVVSKQAGVFQRIGAPDYSTYAEAEQAAFRFAQP